MTDAEFKAWLVSTARVPVVLVEVAVRSGGVETTRYLSSRGYTTGSADTPASTAYKPVIVGGLKVSETLPLNGTAGMAFGDIELDNTTGALDGWLSDIWANRAVNVFVGDVRWVRSDFRLVFSGLVADAGSRSRNLINLKIRDKLQQLNTTVTETKLGGTSTNADRLLPLTFGEAVNVEPLLIDKALLKYQWHAGAAERLIEVRDYGVPVTATADLTAGTFTLAASPAGTITCSVQGAKPSGTYANRIGALIQHIATTYGTTPFVSGDVDSTNFAAFDAANTQPVGLYLADRENVLAVCQRLAASVGAQVCMSAAGKLRLLKVSLPGSPGTAVSANQMLEQSLEVASRPAVIASVKLAYCRNYTVQQNLQTGIPPEHKALFAEQWITATSKDATTATTYKITQEPEQEETDLLTNADATAEATRRLNLWKTQRTIYRYDSGPDLMLEELGGYQTITHGRFGLSGVNAQIIGIERDWLQSRAAFEVLV